MKALTENKALNMKALTEDNNKLLNIKLLGK